jgi:hypothetical protein
MFRSPRTLFPASSLRSFSTSAGTKPSRSSLCYSQRMQITLNIPDDLARQVAPEGKDPARVALEALALEGYRAELLSESALRQMLGFQTRMEVHAFLKQHSVYLHYNLSDLQQDRATAQQVRRKLQDSESRGERRSG